MSRDHSAAASPTVLQRLLLVVFGLVLLAICVGIGELVLRLSGAVDPHLYEDPFVGFSESRDLFTRVVAESGDERFQTSPEKLGFFNQQSFPAEKSDGTFRIFALGGSTTAGRPYDAQFAFPAWLQRYLDAAAPSRRFEVVNAGGISYASYRITLLMRELVRYEPDLFVVYTGHNEFLEERTYSDIIHQNPILKSLRLRLNGLRSYTLARAAIRRVRGKAAELPTTLDADVEARLDSWRGLELYQRDDALRESIVAHFEYNLRQMAAIAADAGVDLIFVSPISNLADFSPFKSEHRPDISHQKRLDFERRVESSTQLLANDLTEDACAELRRAVEIDPLHADGQYLLGRCLLRLSRAKEARAALVQAKENDIAPLRALEEQIEIIAELAAELELPLIDLTPTLEAQTLERFGHTILGSQHLLDHVHPDIPVHSLIAEQILDWLAARELAEIDGSWSVEMAARIFSDAVGAADERYYAQRDLNLAKVLGWAGKLAEAEMPLRRAAEILVDEPEVYLNLGIVLQRTGRLEESQQALRRALELDPANALAHFNLGVTLSGEGRFAEAADSLRAALRLDPDYEEAVYNLGLVQAATGRWEESIDAFLAAHQLRPGTTEILRSLAASYRNLGRLDEAVATLDQALQQDPADIEARIQRAMTLAAKGESEAALTGLDEALARRPLNPEAHFNRGVVLASQGQLQEAAHAYRDAIENSPGGHLTALNNLGILLARSGDPSQAERLLLQAVEIDESYADAHFNLGVVYDSVGQTDRALAAIETAVDLDPANGRYHQALGLILSARGDSERASYHLRQAQQAGVSVQTP